MNKLEELIQRLCPDGVKYKRISDAVNMARGVRVVKKQLTTEGAYPVYQNSRTPMGYYVESNCSADTTFIISAGSAGEIGYSSLEFWAADDCFYFNRAKDIQSRYLYHVLLCQQENIFSKVRRASIPRLARSVVEGLLIPVPPLEIQNEIVRILDNFTDLTAELTAELAVELISRKKQFEYYRNELLSFEGSETITYKNIGDLASFRRGSFPQPYGNAEWYDGEGAMPFVQVADIGDDMRLIANTKRKISILAQPKSVYAPKGSIIISLQGSIGRIAVTQYNSYIDRTVAIFLNLSKELLPMYFVYQLQRIFAIKEKTARGSTIKTITKEEFTNFPIAVPSLKEQERIVTILDRFDALCNDLISGLPTEIEARRKQYEYYRDKLLTFQEV